MSARYLRECADDCEEKPQRFIAIAISRSRKDRFGRQFVLRVARIDIARDGNDRPVQPMGAITRVDCSPLKGCTRAFVTRVQEKKNATCQSNAGGQRSGFITRAVFHCAVLSASLSYDTSMNIHHL